MLVPFLFKNKLLVPVKGGRKQQRKTKVKNSRISPRNSFDSNWDIINWYFKVKSQTLNINGTFIKLIPIKIKKLPYMNEYMRIFKIQFYEIIYFVNGVILIRHKIYIKNSNKWYNIFLNYYFM